MRGHHALLLLLLTGCSFAASDSKTYGRGSNTCESAADCLSGICGSAGFCESGGADPGASVGPVVVLAVYSNEAAEGTLFVSDPFDVAGSLSSDLVIAPRAIVSGYVRWRSEPVDAELKFSRIDQTSDAEEQVRASSSGGGLGVIADADSAAPDERTGQSRDFTTTLRSGLRYSVSATPSAEFAATVPPFYSELTIAEGAPAVDYDVVYPETLSAVHGRLTFPDASSVVGREITAVDPQGRRISTRTTSDADGAFTLYFAESTPDFVLRIRPADGTAVEPTIEVASRYLYPDPSGVAHIQLPARRDARAYVGQIVTPDGMGTPAVLSIKGSEIYDAQSGLIGSFAATIETDETGNFFAMVPASNYDVVVRPRDTQLAVATTMAMLDNESILNASLRLKARLPIEGHVYSNLGMPVAGATLSAFARGEAFSDASDDTSRYNRSVDASSDENGAFTLAVDPGLYDLVLEPQPTSGFAPYVLLSQAFREGAAPRQDTNITLEEPYVITGRVSFSGSEVVSGLAVRAYTIASGRLISLGRSGVDADGNYQLLLPTQLH